MYVCMYVTFVCMYVNELNVSMQHDNECMSVMSMYVCKYVCMRRNVCSPDTIITVCVVPVFVTLLCVTNAARCRMKYIHPMRMC